MGVFMKMIKHWEDTLNHWLLTALGLEITIDRSFPQIRRNPHFRLIVNIEENVLKSDFEGPELPKQELESLEALDEEMKAFVGFHFHV